MNGSALFWSRPLRVFDLDGTLVDTLPDLTLALDTALADLGLPVVGAALVRASLHGGIDGSVDAALAHLQAPTALRGLLLARYRQHYDAALTRHSRAYPGVHELLERLRQRGDRLAVCTNKQQAQAQRVLGSLGLAPFFGMVVGADTCGQRKPHAAPLLHAIAALGGPRAQALFVGDSEVDRACAEAAGVDCLIFGSGYGGIDDPAQAAFDSWLALLAGEPACDRRTPLLQPDR